MDGIKTALDLSAILRFINAPLKLKKKLQFCVGIENEDNQEKQDFLK